MKKSAFHKTIKFVTLAQLSCLILRTIESFAVKENV